jgi:hypothetical protein
MGLFYTCMKRGDQFNKEDMLSTLKTYFYTEVFCFKVIAVIGVAMFENI